MSGWGYSFGFAAGALAQLHTSILRSAGVQNPRRRRNSTDIECIVCRRDSTETKFSTSSPTSVCAHPPRICVSCLQQVILTAITTGGFISGVICPHLDCTQRLDYHDVQKWATPEVFDRYDRLLLQYSLRGDERYILCLEPSCTAGQEHDGGELSNIVTCHHCGTKQCFRHRALWHEGFTCEQWDEHQQTMTNQQEMTDEWIQTETKPCPGPGCGRRIQKYEGCNHMECKRPGGCGHQFCWECFAPWLEIISVDNSRHYDHCVYYSGLPGNNPAPTERVAARRSHEPPGREIPGQIQNRPLVPPNAPMLPPEHSRGRATPSPPSLLYRLISAMTLPRPRSRRIAPPSSLLYRPLGAVTLQQPRRRRVAPSQVAGPEPRTRGWANFSPFSLLYRLISAVTLPQPRRRRMAPRQVAGLGPGTRGRAISSSSSLLYRPISSVTLQQPRRRCVAPSQVAGPGPRTQSQRKNTNSLVEVITLSTLISILSMIGLVVLLGHMGLPNSKPSTDYFYLITSPPTKEFGKYASTPHVSRNIGNSASNAPPREAYTPPHLRIRTIYSSDGPPWVVNRPPNIRGRHRPKYHLREPSQPAETQTSLGGRRSSSDHGLYKSKVGSKIQGWISFS